MRTAGIGSSGFKVCALVPSAGIGRRMRSKTDKPFIRLCGKPMIFYALKALQDSPLISEIIIIAKPDSISKVKKFAKRRSLNKVKDVVKGGSHRSESVFNGLSKISADTDLVLIHDAARPFINQRLIKRVIDAARRHGAAVTCMPVKPTVKEVNGRSGFVNRTLDRRLLWEAQTPQVFKKGLLLAAYRKTSKKPRRFTDDASLVEGKGHKVKVVMGDYRNIKITTAEDLIIAEAILKTHYPAMSTK